MMNSVSEIVRRLCATLPSFTAAPLPLPLPLTRHFTSSSVSCPSQTAACSSSCNSAFGAFTQWSACSSSRLFSLCSSSSSHSSTSSSSSMFLLPHRCLLILRAKDEDEGGGKKGKAAKTAVRDDAQKRFAQAQLAQQGAILNRIRAREQRRKDREEKRKAGKRWHGKSMIDQLSHIDKICKEHWSQQNPDKPPALYPFKGGVGLRFYHKAWTAVHRPVQKIRPFSVIHAENEKKEHVVYSDFPHSYWTITKFKPKSAHSAKRRVWGVFTFKGQREGSARKIPGANKKDVWRFLPPPYPAERAHQLIVYADDEEIPVIHVPNEEEAQKLATPKANSVLVQAPFTMKLPSKALPKSVGFMIRRLAKARYLREKAAKLGDEETATATATANE